MEAGRGPTKRSKGSAVGQRMRRRACSGNLTAGAPTTVDAPAVVYLVFPVYIRGLGLVVNRGVRVRYRERLECLNSIDRRRQCRQFWSFVFHSIHLLSLMIFTYIS